MCDDVLAWIYESWWVSVFCKGCRLWDPNKRIKDLTSLPYTDTCAQHSLTPLPTVTLHMSLHLQSFTLCFPLSKLSLSLSPILVTAQSFSLSAENPKKKTPPLVLPVTESDYLQQHSKCAVRGRLLPLLFVPFYISLFLFFGAALIEAEEHLLWAVFRPSHWIRKVQTTGA